MSTLIHNADRGTWTLVPRPLWDDQPILVDGFPLDPPDERGLDQADEDYCFVCKRATLHFAEHDDLVEAGLAVYRGGDVVWVSSLPI